MRQSSAPELLLPEIETSSVSDPALQTLPPSVSEEPSMIRQTMSEASVPVEQTVITQPPEAHKTHVIGRGGYTLAVPGAEKMVAPFDHAKVSLAGRAGNSVMVHPVAGFAPAKGWKNFFSSAFGVSMVANAVLLAAFAHQVTRSGSEISKTPIATAPSTIESVIAEKTPSNRHTAAGTSKDNTIVLTPRRVKVERFRVSEAKPVQKRPVAALPATENDVTESGKNTTSILSADAQATTSIAIAVPRPKPALPPKIFSAHASTGSFVKELASLRNGTRVKPVTIVHMGDSHIASDAFTRGIRKGLQARYGNSGRGAVLPAKAFKYTRADGVKMTTSGAWSSASSLTTKTGPYGLSGVRVASSSSSSKMTLSTTGNPFDWAEVTVLTGPNQGKVKLTAGSESTTFNAAAPTVGSKVVRVKAYGKTATVSPAGGKTTVLNWATGRQAAGVRYINFGIVSATAYLQKRWDPKLVANDIKHLNPDLVVWGYGTNEGFNSNLDMGSYRKQVASIYKTVSAAAPKADWLFLGPASGLSRRGVAAGYCNGYRIPVKLGAVRNTLREFASENGRHFWDWASAMGGDCAIDKWARSTPRLALSDRVHLNRAGYQKSAAALVTHINSLVDKPQTVAAVDVDKIN